MTLNQLFHPTDQLPPDVIKQQVEDSLPAAAVRRDRGQAVMPPNRLRAFLMTLLIPFGERKYSFYCSANGMTLAQENLLGFMQFMFGDNSQVPAIKSQIFLHHTLHFNHSWLVVAARLAVRRAIKLFAQCSFPALNIQSIFFFPK